MSQPLIYTAFHLNLAFSSIEEEQRTTVIERCYWPLLRLAEDGFPIGIEATSFTLREIEKRSPEWIVAFKALLDAGRVELIGSGYTQMIAPLVPAEMTAMNLKLGMKDYQNMLGHQPRVAMVNEQAYAPGLVPLYLEAGFEAIIMDWSEPSSRNKGWSKSYAHRPQILAGAQGSQIPVVWSDALSFQKFQRYAHAELEADEYFEFLGLQLENGAQAFPLYTSDAEVFDYRPGRFSSEAAQSGAVTEYERIALLLSALHSSDAVCLGTPSDALALLDASATPIRLETAQAPIPVKKQRKYNVLRWGVTGRNDLALNTGCFRILDEIRGNNGGEDEYRTLCELWASDSRTHLTDSRWRALLAHDAWKKVRNTKNEPGMSGGEAEWPPHINVVRNGRYLIVESEGSHLRLNCGRGLSIQSFGPGRFENGQGGAPAPNGLIGTLAHGFFEDIEFGADFYSGHLVCEPADKHKYTDLLKVEPDVVWRPDLEVVDVRASLQGPMGEITKTVRYDARRNRLTVWYDGKLTSSLEGSVRCAHLTLNPRAFDQKSLYFSASNGGRGPERHMLWDEGLATVNHGAPVSRLVSATTGLGMTDSVLELGDNRYFIRLEMARGDAAGLGLITSQAIGESCFVRAAITLGESDETGRTRVEEETQMLPEVIIRYSINFGEQTKRL